MLSVLWEWLVAGEYVSAQKQKYILPYILSASWFKGCIYLHANS